jgi:ABC-2 type transport system ATP-binding protein
LEPAVHVKGLVKTYQGSVKALDGVDLEVEAGKVFSLLGPNGAGKTTLMRILTTQFEPTAGEACVFGLNVVKDGARVRKLVSYVPQEMSVWTDLSGYENLLIYAKIYAIPRDEREKIILDSLEIMGLSGVTNNLVRTYSGGMMRRLEIACAMLIKPRIMFLDEPTIGLDPSARKVVWEELTSFKKEYGVTIFFNTHYMDEADQYADEIAIVSGGKIVAYGTPVQLKDSVGGEIIQFSVQGEEFSEDLLSKIRQLDQINDIVVSNSDLSVIVKDAETALPKIMEVLRQNNLPVKKIALTEPTLNDVFLKYAGTTLDTGGGIRDIRQVRRMIRRG